VRLAFLGTPDFAAKTLEALVAAGHEVAAVYSQPARPAGRGNKLQQSAVEQWARAHGLEVRTPVSLKDPQALADFAALKLDVAVVAAYGLILPKAYLAAPTFSCLNVHGSLLPRWRGAAPIQRAIMAGDQESGVTIMRMEAGLDTGPMLKRDKIPIPDAMTGGQLHDALAAMGARLMVETLADLAKGPIQEEIQPAEGVTYAAKLTNADQRIDWTESARLCLDRIRAMAPRPGTFAVFGEERWKILSAAPGPATKAAPGFIIDDQLTVAAGDGRSLRLTMVQRPGGKPLPTADFLRGAPVSAGSSFVPCPAID
jgi:methionyl-tRNA formyltransferase